MRQADFAFDIVVTAERVGAYKPDWPHFNTALADLQALGISPARILHVGQSLRADVTPANKLGLKCAWVNRSGRALGLSGEGAAEARPDLTVSSLQELVAAIARRFRLAPPPELFGTSLSTKRCQGCSALKSRRHAALEMRSAMLGTHPSLWHSSFCCLVCALPSWPYSSGWGYYPSGTLGIVLIVGADSAPDRTNLTRFMTTPR